MSGVFVMVRDEVLWLEIERLKQWIKQNFNLIIVNDIIVCFLYSSWTLSRVPLVDTMLYINMPHYTYNWLDIGREGAVLSKWIFQQMYYNPYLATFAGYLFILIGGNIFGYIGYRCSMSCGYIWTFVPFMFISPVFAEQFYFKFQLLELGWACILCAVSVGLNYFIIYKKERRLYILSIPMMIWSFHTYQTFVIIYAVMVGFAYILLGITGGICAERKDVTWKALLLEHVVVFGVANLAGWMITSVFFSSSGYLESTVVWGTVSIGVCIKKIIEHVVLIFSSDKILEFFGHEYEKKIFYTAFYGVFSATAVLLILKEFLRNRKEYYFVLLSAAVCIQLSPLLLTVYMGNIPSIRAQLAYPFVMTFDAIISYIILCRQNIKKRNIIKAMVGVVMLMAVWQQLSVTLRLVYTDGVRADEDIRLAETLNIRLIEMNALDKPVAFVGTYENNLDPACIKGEIIGQSVFDMFTELEPHYTVSTWHACSEMNAMGIYKTGK